DDAEPEAAAAPAPRTRRRTAKKAAAAPAEDEQATDQAETADTSDSSDSSGSSGSSDRDDSDDDRDGEGGPRRRRRRGGRRRRKPGDGDDANSSDDSQPTPEASTSSSKDDDGDSSEEGGTRRRRRRRREGDVGGGNDDPSNTVTRVRRARSAEDEITSIQGSTRLEAKKQRRREGREAGRRRAPIVSEAEFLARRESVDRVMVIRQRDELTQIGVLEDKVLVEHYVARESQTSLIGNVYLGRVQNVLPSMEAAFIDIGKGRNAVLYAGEVNWSALGHKDGQPRKIESVLSSGQSILVQVTKDPIGHKGARLTSQVSLAGRFLVYVPDGTTSGISRKLPDTERNRLKTLLKEIVPDTAGVIVRTAAEGASEEELTRDVERLKARWEDIDAKTKGQAPQLLYGEPDLTLKVVRDLFTEDFKKLVIQGDDAWTSVQDYVAHVAPDLQERVQRFESDNGQDIFAAYRVDEQIAKGLDRKVWLPSGGSLVIDRTEAMTVVDVNTGKFTGSGGNLEETVTKNNLEAAEEIVRQLRLRDIGGIIVVDFIDMVLESNRDLVLRRMVECLGRDRTRHQVAEVTSLGLVQMTRKRIGTGLLEAFSENCEHCQGRGVMIHEQPVAPRSSDDAPRSSGGGRRSRGGGGGGGGRGRGQDDQSAPSTPKVVPSPKDVAAMAKPENAAPVDEEETFESLDAVEPAKPVETVETAETVESVPAPEPVETAPVEVAEEVAPEAPATEPEAPKVVKRTRRTTRSTATISTTPAEMPVVVPAAAPVEAQPEPVAVTAPEPPKVVTRTRGRRTPAKEDATSTPEAGTDEADADASDSVVGHVPVKKRGARKR
ncbi:MAG: Rne/Rng family ribonuclease, partial [Nocardioides sp.]|nr:Rne/Rng family ribonuclease [Nocardioides sp.]